MKPEHITHLEFIQSNIARMNHCSFQMKGWMITIVSAFLALFVASTNGEETGNNLYFLIATLPTLVFWYLDSYYLQQERKFRGVYNAVAGITKKDGLTIKEFSMPLNQFTGGEYSLIYVMLSKTEALLYLPVIIILIAAYCVTR